MDLRPPRFTPDDFDRLTGLIEAAGDRIRDLDDLRSKIEGQRATLLLRMRELREKALALRAQGFRLPPPPDLPESPRKWIANAEDFEALWLEMHRVMGSELTLSGGLRLETFRWQIADMDEAGREIKQARDQAVRAVAARDRLGDEMRADLHHGRLAIPRRFAPNHPVVLLLAPEAHKLVDIGQAPPILVGEWNPIQGELRFSWRPTPIPQLQHYEIRQCSEPEYDVLFETTIWSGLETHAWLHPTFGPGASMRFRLYAVLASHEAFGSKDIAITRPFP